MRTVQFYINNQRVDLFDDEQIEITSSIQNIQDIAKVFTDFSQSFSVPASKANNIIFDYFYNNDVDGTYIANNRADARIEINHIPFREGKVQLEGSEIKNGEAESYQVTFYGDVVTLKDLFGEDKLSDLDYTGINQLYDGASVQTTITSTSDLDVRFPLISSSRVWTYGDAAATDISVSGNAIEYTELFPAVKDKKILDLIASQYGVTFTGNFLSNKRFTNSFTWFKNRETTNFTSEPVDLTWSTPSPNSEPAALTTNQCEITAVDIQTYTQPASFTSWIVGGEKHYIKVYISNTSNSSTWYLDVYKDGVKVNTITGSGNQLANGGGSANYTVFQPNIQTNNGLSLGVYTFKLRCDASLTFDYDVQYEFQYSYTNGSGIYSIGYSNANVSGSGSITNYLDFSSIAPDQKISEWFSGTLKEFNLTCYPTDTLTFQIEPLADWYAAGDEVNITPYTDVKSIKVDRAKLYNEIAFKWQTSKSFMNEAYEEINAVPYGDLKEVFPGYDGGKYEVTLPFETLLFNKFTNENLQVAYCLTTAPDYKPYVPKPVKLYLYEEQTADVDFYFDNGSTTDQLTSYMPFGQEVQYNAGGAQAYSMNFGEEISSLLLVPIGNSLYRTYYQPYLVNLFDPKTRLVTVECILPLSVLTQLTLDDAVIIRDKKYRINDMKSNLTTGKVRLVLISDWVKRSGKIVVPEVDQGGGTIVVPVKPIKPTRGGYATVSAIAETPFVTPSETLPYNFTAEGTISFTVPSNGTGADRINSMTVSYYNPDGDLIYTDYITIVQSGSTGFLLNETGGYILTETIDRIEL